MKVDLGSSFSASSWCRLHSLLLHSLDLKFVLTSWQYINSISSSDSSFKFYFLGFTGGFTNSQFPSIFGKFSAGSSHISCNCCFNILALKSSYHLYFMKFVKRLMFELPILRFVILFRLVLPVIIKLSSEGRTSIQEFNLAFWVSISWQVFRSGSGIRVTEINL